MEVVQLIGSYAGFAAVIGLAVLSALYFSQARDVRRLREWAGRAPERAGAPGVQSHPSPATPAATRQPAAPPGAATAAPAGAAQPQAAVGAPANANATTAPAPAGAGATAMPATAGAATAAPSTAPSPPGKQPAVPAAAPAVAGAPSAAPPAGPGAPRPAPTGGAPRPPARVALGPTPQRRPISAASPAASTSIGASATPWYRRLAPRYIVLIVAGVLIVGGGIAYGVTQLRGAGGQPSSPAAQAPAGGERAAGEGGGQPAQAAAVEPGEITVAVLNGTTVPGLARSVANDLRAAGYRRGRTDNATEQARAESVVFYSDGSERAARSVGEELGIDQRQPMDADSQALAGNADVVVVLGADRAR